MKFISFISSIDNIINTNSAKLKDLIETQEYIQNQIDMYVRLGYILEINKPQIKVYYDTLLSSFTCVPSNVLTMHMSLTFKYDMGDIVHYNHFKDLIDNEPEFVSDVNRRYKMQCRKAELRSKETFQGLEYYVDVFGFPKYDSRDDLEILDTLKYEFNLNANKAKNIQEFKAAMSTSIDRIDALYIMTGGSFKADIMWTHLFSTSIKSDGERKYRECRNINFRNLYYIYSPEQIQKRINLDGAKEYQYAPPTQTNTEDRTPMMVFMSLQIGFSQKQLKKKFRKLAVKYHPDKIGGDKDKFLYLKECYDALLKTF